MSQRKLDILGLISLLLMSVTAAVAGTCHLYYGKTSANVMWCIVGGYLGLFLSSLTLGILLSREE